MRTVSMLMICIFSSCATIIQPGPDRIPVDSEPRGAQVRLNGNVVGVTPMVVLVSRPDDCNLQIEKDGFQQISVGRNKVVAGWVFGNILLGGVIGLTVDLATSHQGKYAEDPVFAHLEPAAKTSSLSR